MSKVRSGNVTSLCVYCGSSDGARHGYKDAARALAREMVARGIRLVYGGAGIGLMGAIADEVLALGGEAVGVMPEALMHKELVHQTLTELHVTPSMHARKLMMADLADAFVALPGGIGTFEELFEVWTWAQLGLHSKPVGLLNVGGYYDGLIGFLDQARDERFIRAEHRDMLIVANDPHGLFDSFASFQPPALPRWLTPTGS